MPAHTDSISTSTVRVGVLGARGFVGRELIALVGGHPSMRLERAWSDSQAGEPVASHAPGAPAGLRFTSTSHEDPVDCGLDVLILALPNGASRQFMRRVEGSSRAPRIVVDLSADHRFDERWAYGLPETNRNALIGATRIASPGCYATAIQLALHPVRDQLIGEPNCFGVSGYSGAGSTPNDRNDPNKLAENVLPYSSIGHLHEREVSEHLGHAIRFAPSVAPFARGIVCTVLFELDHATSARILTRTYERVYGDEPLLQIVGEAMPLVGQVRESPRAIVGGIQVDLARPHRAAAVCVLDNLLKGAASQALQSLNVALGLPETEGLGGAPS